MDLLSHILSTRTRELNPSGSGRWWVTDLVARMVVTVFTQITFSSHIQRMIHIQNAEINSNMVYHYHKVAKQEQYVYRQKIHIHNELVSLLIEYD